MQKKDTAIALLLKNFLVPTAEFFSQEVLSVTFFKLQGTKNSLFTIPHLI